MIDWYVCRDRGLFLISLARRTHHDLIFELNPQTHFIMTRHLPMILTKTVNRKTAGHSNQIGGMFSPERAHCLASFPF